MAAALMPNDIHAAIADAENHGGLLALLLKARPLHGHEETKSWRKQDGYRWSAKRGAYLTPAGGVVPDRQVREALDGYLGTIRNWLAGWARRMVDGAISVARWFSGALHKTAVAIIVSAALGAGGWRASDSGTWGRAGEAIDRQEQHLVAFRKEIEQKQSTPAEGDPAKQFPPGTPERAGMYGESGRGEYERERQDAKASAGYDQERRMLDSAAAHCLECIRFAAAGWQTLGTLPQIGAECSCLTNCKCVFEYRIARLDETKSVATPQPRAARTGNGGAGKGNQMPVTEDVIRLSTALRKNLLIKRSDGKYQVANERAKGYMSGMCLTDDAGNKLEFEMMPHPRAEEETDDETPADPPADEGGGDEMTKMIKAAVAAERTKLLAELQQVRRGAVSAFTGGDGSQLIEQEAQYGNHAPLKFFANGQEAWDFGMHTLSMSRGTSARCGFDCADLLKRARGQARDKGLNGQWQKQSLRRNFNHYQHVVANQRAGLVVGDAQAGGTLVPVQQEGPLFRLVNPYGRYKAVATNKPMGTDRLDTSFPIETNLVTSTGEIGNIADDAGTPQWFPVKLQAEEFRSYVPISRNVANDALINTFDEVVYQMQRSKDKKADAVGWIGDGTKGSFGITGMITSLINWYGTATTQDIPGGLYPSAGAGWGGVTRLELINVQATAFRNMYLQAGLPACWIVSPAFWFSRMAYLDQVATINSGNGGPNNDAVVAKAMNMSNPMWNGYPVLFANVGMPNTTPATGYNVPALFGVPEVTMFYGEVTGAQQVVIDESIDIKTNQVACFLFARIAISNVNYQAPDGLPFDDTDSDSLPGAMVGLKVAA